MFSASCILLLMSSFGLTRSLSIPFISGRQSFSRGQTTCETFGYIQSDNGYNLNNNLWGKNDSTGGYQCLEYYNTKDDGVSWGSTWKWEGDKGVKSYPYSGKMFKPKTVSQISKLPTSFYWYYTNTKVVANVAYDLFTSADPNAPKSRGDFELMIWLASYSGVTSIGHGEGPISYPYLAGRQWDLYHGINHGNNKTTNDMDVYSFVARNGPVNSFQADVKEFFNYIANKHGYPASKQYLTTYQAGTETFKGGPTTFVVDKFSAGVQ